MALDATIGGALSDSYGALADIKAYWDSVAYDYSAYTDPDIEQAARRGTNALEWQRKLFVGQPETATQRLHFPATGMDMHGLSLPDGEIPINVFYAQCELAYRELVSQNSLTPDIVLSAAENLFVKRRKVGSSGVEREFGMASDAAQIIPQVTSAQALLARYLLPKPRGEYRTAYLAAV